MKKYLMIILLQSMVAVGYAQTDTVMVFSKSYTAEGNKEYAKAIELMNSIYSQNSYPVNLRLGWLWYLKADYAKAQVYYKTAMTIEPKSIEARLGYAYPVSAMENWTEVINVYNEILGIDPDNSFINYKQAYIYYYIRKEYKTALSYVSKVTKLFPFDFDANYLTAQIQLSLGNIKEAKSAAQLALEYNPQSKDALKLFESLK